MAEQRRWNLDRHVTAMMVDDMLFNPILAAKVLLGIELPPHQELRVMTMWTKMYTIDDSGFSTGKTHNFALVAALRSILLRNRISGMISKTFAQGKNMFRYFDNWANANPRFRNSIRVKQGKIQIIHGSDVHYVDFRGGAQVRVLPPDFMKDSERLRGERWHDGYFDEWTTFGNMGALNKTIIGRVTNVNDYPECPVRQNHIHMGSTPNFTHHPSYSIVKRISRSIRAGNPDYARFTSNYRHIPETEKWSRLVSRKTIFLMQTNQPKNIVKMEVDGLWQKNSGTYYSSQVIYDAQFRKSLVTLRRLKADDTYVAAIDIATGGNRDGKSDDCSLTIIRIQKDKMAHHALTVRYNGLRDFQFSGIVHKYHRIFGFALIGYDPGGGGLFIKDRLRETNQIIDNVELECNSLIDLQDKSGMQGERILVPITRGDAISRLWGSMRSDSVLVNRMHREFSSNIESRQLALSPFWDGWGGNGSQWDCDSKRAWLNSNPTLEPKQRAAAEMDLAVSQLMLVDIGRDENGQPDIDSFGMYKFGSKSKKDSAYSLIYANTMRLLHSFFIDAGVLRDLANEDDSTEIVTGRV